MNFRHLPQTKVSEIHHTSVHHSHIVFEISYLILIICLDEICLVESNGKISVEKGVNLHFSVREMRVKEWGVVTKA